MRIHTNDVPAVRTAIYQATASLPGVYATTSRHGSRTHAGALELSLEGNGHRKNTGTSGAGDESGATWDEWGVVLAAVFAADPGAMCGSKAYPAYRNAEHYHFLTGDRFRAGTLPEDTHKRHRWTLHLSDNRNGCASCSSDVPTWAARLQWESDHNDNRKGDAA